MAALQYADIFSNILRELYGQSQVSVDLYNSNCEWKKLKVYYVFSKWM